MLLGQRLQAVGDDLDTLVPASMFLIGTELWYYPAWFDMHIRDLDIGAERIDLTLDVIADRDRGSFEETGVAHRDARSLGPR